MYVRNAAGQMLGFNLVLQEDGSPATGLVVTGQRVIDGGGAETLDGTIYEIGGGQYVVHLDAADTNGRQVSILLSHPLAVAQEKTILPFDVADVTQTINTANASGGTIHAGQPVALNAGAMGTLANAAAGGLLAIGIATSDSASLDPLSVLTSGQLTLLDWTQVVGVAALTQGAAYYLDHTAGRLVSTPPAGPTDQFQFVGLALTTQTLYAFPPAMNGLSKVALTGVYNDLLHRPGTETEGGGRNGFLDVLNILGVQPVLFLDNPASPNPAVAVRLFMNMLRLELQNAPAGNQVYLYLASDGGKSVAFLDSFEAIAGHRNSYFGVVDATGTLQKGVYGTLPDGSSVSGGLITGVGGGGGGTASGVYNPVVTAVANVSSVTSRPAQWLQVGNTVTVSGVIDLTPLSPGPVAQWLLSLPVASVLTNPEQVAGTGLPDQSGAPLEGPVSVTGDAASGQALMGTIQSSFVTPTAYFFHFTYQVL